MSSIPTPIAPVALKTIKQRDPNKHTGLTNNSPPHAIRPTHRISPQLTRPLRLRQRLIQSNTLTILTLTLILPTPLTLSPRILTMTALPLPMICNVFVRHNTPYTKQKQ